MKKLASLLLAGVLSIGFMGTTVFADTLERTSSGKQFNNAWTATATSGTAKLTYGFNTTLINEDFTWSENSSKSHYAQILRAGIIYNGSSKTPGNTSKIEIQHGGIILTYRSIWA